LSPDLLARVRALKPQLLELLRAGAGAVASPTEWRLLTTLALHPGLAADELAAATKLDQARFAEALHTLLRRAEIAADRRGRLHLRIV
jgi:DNA-binding MarR family transcriptional regulator